MQGGKREAHSVDRDAPLERTIAQDLLGSGDLEDLGVPFLGDGKNFTCLIHMTLNQMSP